ncbi:MAG: SDR family NAD(P)-dependent oxidoreductase [Acidimicrobiales bacterium]
MTTIHQKTTAVIIGGGGGVGRGIALGLAGQGARVVIADIDLDTAAAVADELTASGHDAVACVVDATELVSLAALADMAEARYGSIDILVNTVGVVHSGEILDAPDSDWAWVLEFNVMTVVRACAVFVPRIRAHGRGGHVVNTASMAGLWASKPEEVAGTHLGLYTTSKFAVVGFTEALRGELASDGIGVSCLCPGTVDSNLMQTSLRHRPERFGGAVEVDATLGKIPYAMAQEEVGRVVVAGIEHDRALILTHPQARHFVDRRAASHADDFDFFTAVGELA